MDCPKCNWDSKLTSRSVSPRGYHSHYLCKGVTDCNLRFEVTIDLYQAYDLNMIPETPIQGGATAPAFGQTCHPTVR